ncbi:hypothetical protein Btru_029680 [Bulinus truncatus]|nr:hypothetical protein Btru_029680 [Bulinus truncatus]
MPAPKKLPITLEQENILWESKHLSLESSTGLIQAVIFYLIKCFGVWQGKYLKLLTTEHVKYGEDELGKYITIDTTSVVKVGKIIRRYDDPGNPRSLYKIMKMYQRYLANEGPLLVRPISSIKDYVCYSPWPLGVGIIDQTAHNLMKEVSSSHLYANASISLLAIDTLKNKGIGGHCMGTWTHHLFSFYRKNYPKDVFDICNKMNCEEKNLSLCLLISRLLDPPYPSDRAALAVEKKKLSEELESRKQTHDKALFDSWFNSLSTFHYFDDDEEVIYQKTEELVEEDGDKRSLPEDNGEQMDSPAKRHRACKRDPEQTNMISDSPRSTTKNGKCRLQNSDTGLVNKTTENGAMKIVSVSSIRESSYFVQNDEGDHKSECKLKVKCEEPETSETKPNVKTEAMDETDDLPLTFIKKEITEETESTAYLDVGVKDLTDNRKVKCNSSDCSSHTGRLSMISQTPEELSVVKDSFVIPPAVPTPSVDSILLLRNLLKHDGVFNSGEVDKDNCSLNGPETSWKSDDDGCDLSPPVLSPQPVNSDESVSDSVDRSFSSLPAQEKLDETDREDLVSAHVSKHLPIATDRSKELHLVLSNFPSIQSTKISSISGSDFPVLRAALEKAADCSPSPSPLNPQNENASSPLKASYVRFRRAIRALQRRRGIKPTFRNLKTFKHCRKVNSATSGSKDSTAPLQQPASCKNSGNCVQTHPSETSLLNSSLSELQPHSGIYHLSSDHEKQAAYQTVKIRTDSGTKLFTIGDLHLEQTASSVMLTSETNIGDYFPPETQKQALILICTFVNNLFDHEHITSQITTACINNAKLKTSPGLKGQMSNFIWTFISLDFLLTLEIFHSSL